MKEKMKRNLAILLSLNSLPISYEACTHFCRRFSCFRNGLREMLNRNTFRFVCDAFDIKQEKYTNFSMKNCFVEKQTCVYLNKFCFSLVFFFCWKEKDAKQL